MGNGAGTVQNPEEDDLQDGSQQNPTEDSGPAAEGKTNNSGPAEGKTDNAAAVEGKTVDLEEKTDLMGVHHCDVNTFTLNYPILVEGGD